MMKKQYYDGLSIGLLISAICFVIFSFNDLPSEIPIHFNAKGEADNFGSKHMLWVVLGIAVALFFFLGFISQLKQGFNFPGPVSTTTQEAQRSLAQHFTSQMRAWTMAIILIVIYVMIKEGQQSNSYINFLIYPMLVLLLPLIGGYYYNYSKIEKNRRAK